jgi:hypothetical protein
MIRLRIPYPMGFYAKGLDGRIDDLNGGWKGRGLWSTSGDRTPWLMEGGKARSHAPSTFRFALIRWRTENERSKAPPPCGGAFSFALPLGGRGNAGVASCPEGRSGHS